MDVFPTTDFCCWGFGPFCSQLLSSSIQGSFSPPSESGRTQGHLSKHHSIILPWPWGGNGVGDDVYLQPAMSIARWVSSPILLWMTAEGTNSNVYQPGKWWGSWPQKTLAMPSEHGNQVGPGPVLASWMEHVSRIHDKWTTLTRKIQKFLECRVRDETSAWLSNFPVFFSDRLVHQSKITRKVQWWHSGYTITVQKEGGWETTEVRKA